MTRPLSLLNKVNRCIYHKPTCRLLLAISVLIVSAACRDTVPVAPSGTSATSATNKQDSPAADAVKVETEQIRLAPGASLAANVRLIIAKPFHVNANPATHSYLIPTQLSLRSVQAADGITAGAPVYPQGIERKLAFDESPLRVYEDTVDIKLPLTAAKDAVTGERAVPLRVRVQPCDDEACYPPRTLEATISVVIAK